MDLLNFNPIASSAEISHNETLWTKLTMLQNVHPYYQGVSLKLSGFVSENFSSSSNDKDQIRL